ncbi:XRE family transcriptional regulator [Streptomyces luteogriseus]|uniref:XRE family transcriptional regulator n=1 Tax=Streptomyces luteogriseus TaxID=68233 RepID=UPI003801CE14
MARLHYAWTHPEKAYIARKPGSSRHDKFPEDMQELRKRIPELKVESPHQTRGRGGYPKREASVEEERAKGELQTQIDDWISMCKATYGLSLSAPRRGTADPPTSESVPLGPAHVVSHKFVPIYLGADVEPLLAGAEPLQDGPGGLEHRVLPAGHPDAAPDSRLYVYACGVAIFHLVQPRSVECLGELAAWRYRSYDTDLDWATKHLQRRLAQEGSATEAAAPYVLSAYLLEDSPWEGAHLETALQVLATPSVLVDRNHPGGAERLGDDVERGLFIDGYRNQDAVDFGIQAVSMGVAGWSGVAYHPLSPERALAMDEIVELELDVQTLWALSAYVRGEVEAGRDPVMRDEEHGLRWLRGAYSRLTVARDQETTPHQRMRKAVLATSDLPDRLRHMQEALRESIT